MNVYSLLHLNSSLSPLKIFKRILSNRSCRMSKKAITCTGLKFQRLWNWHKNFQTWCVFDSQVIWALIAPTQLWIRRAIELSPPSSRSATVLPWWPLLIVWSPRVSWLFPWSDVSVLTSSFPRYSVKGKSGFSWVKSVSTNDGLWENGTLGTQNDK